MRGFEQQHAFARDGAVDFGAIADAMPVAAGHEVLVADRARLEDGGAEEEPALGALRHGLDGRDLVDERLRRQPPGGFGIGKDVGQMRDGAAHGGDGRAFQAAGGRIQAYGVRQTQRTSTPLSRKGHERLLAGAGIGKEHVDAVGAPELVGGGDAELTVVRHHDAGLGALPPARG